MSLLSLTFLCIKSVHSSHSDPKLTQISLKNISGFENGQVPADFFARPIYQSLTNVDLPKPVLIHSEHLFMMLRMNFCTRVDI